MWGNPFAKGFPHTPSENSWTSRPPWSQPRTHRARENKKEMHEQDTNTI